MPDTSSYRIYEIFAILLTLLSIRAVPVFLDETLYGLILKLVISAFIIYSLPYLRDDLTVVALLYCGSIAVGFLFHKMLSVEEAKLYGEALKRITPVIVIVHYRYRGYYDNNLVKGFALSFFVLECLLAIYEKVTMTHLIGYQSDSQAMNASMDTDMYFRSFSLMAHPLFNANVLSIFLAFILCSNTLQKSYKMLLVLLGLGAIWAFNSRACMLMWLLIIVYRIFFYDKGLKWMLGSLAILAVVLPSFVLYVQKTGSLGRLDFDFSDGSSMTRIWAFALFLEHPWSLREMIMGGTILYYPGVMQKNSIGYLTLENGVLMDLGYWGFVLGTIKILGEIAITYIALAGFKFKDKLIIMIAMWGVAMMNNNSYFNFLMIFFMCAYLAFGLNQGQTNNVRIVRIIKNTRHNGLRIVSHEEGSTKYKNYQQ